MMDNLHMGSGFDDFLEEEGILEECTAEALKRVIAWEFNQAMEKEHITKTKLARDIHSSRSQVDRLLDPTNTSLSLKTLAAAAQAMGKHIEINITDLPEIEGDANDDEHNHIESYA